MTALKDGRSNDRNRNSDVDERLCSAFTAALLDFGVVWRCFDVFLSERVPWASPEAHVDFNAPAEDDASRRDPVLCKEDQIQSPGAQSDNSDAEFRRIAATQSFEAIRQAFGEDLQPWIWKPEGKWIAPNKPKYKLC